MNSQPRFIFVPLGSAGDVHPLVWLAKLMRARGHEVRVIIHRAVADIAERAGLTVVVTGSLEQQEELVRHPDLWHPRRAFALLASRFPDWAREALPAIRDTLAPGRSVLVGGGIAFGARIASEVFRVPLVTVQLQPAAFLGVEDAPILRAGWDWIKSAPRWLRRGIFALGHAQVDRMVAPPLNALRAEWGLRSPVRGVMRDWWMSPDRVLALFPDWFAPCHGDWPAQTRLTRFPLYDESEERPVQPEVEAFLREGEAPLLFTPGSANRQAREFFAEAAEACVRLRRRGLLVTRFPEQLPAVLPGGVRHFDYVPFSRVFPRCAAVVHHGGVGTCAQGMAAGVPQLVMALAHDQPDNGWRLRRLGVGDFVYAGAFRAAVVAEKLGALLESPEAARACGEVQRRMAAQMPPGEVAGLLEAVCAGGRSGGRSGEALTRDKDQERGTVQ